jgi:hypothetical protein
MGFNLFVPQYEDFRLANLWYKQQLHKKILKNMNKILYLLLLVAILCIRNDMLPFFFLICLVKS